MSLPILATKLYVPPLRPGTVLRPRLLQRLDAGLARRLTLISAPAGFGKTTLAAAWVAGCGRPVAWLSLDEGDNDPTRFLTYLVAALQTVAPDLGQGALAALQAPQPPPAEAILTALLNAIAARDEPMVLVLDDYHVLDAAAVDQALTFLIERLPPQLHLVVVSREDPQLPLPRLRARGELTELRAADLRFTAGEAAEFLRGAMGLALTADEVAALGARTEGWIAGLLLAALSLQGRSDAAGFVRSFAGSHRFVLDYLVEEVLERQPEGIQAFLLQSSILDRLCGPLCEAVTLAPAGSGQETLEYLERANLFVIPLDERRLWFRFHHLFAEVLQARLNRARPGPALDLHRRASQWYAQNGFSSDAIRYALAGEDFERAAELIELEARAMRSGVLEAVWLGWAQALPDRFVRSRPVLSAYYAFALLPSELDAAEVRLQDAERWLQKAADATDTSATVADGMVVSDAMEFRSLPGTIAIARAYIAGAVQDAPGIVRHAQQALELLPEDDHFWRGAAASLMGIAHWAEGDLDAAHRYVTAGMADLQTAAGPASATAAAFLLADIRLAQGRLREAEHTIRQSLQRALHVGEPFPQGTPDLHVLLSEVHLERNDLMGAEECLQDARALGEYAGLFETRHRWYTVMARIRLAQGDLQAALELLTEAERLFNAGPNPESRPIAALRARVWLAQGRVAEAQAWAQENGLSMDDELDFRREFEHITLARLLFARYRSDPAGSALREVAGFLERLRRVAEAGGRVGSLIEILVLQALAHRDRGDTPLALACLERALALAEPEDYVRSFVDEGQPLAALLRALEALAAGGMPRRDAYRRRVLAAGEAQPAGAAPSSPERGDGAPRLIEPLSERELEVLRLLRTELSGPEIAHELTVSLNTLRTHTKNIYGKLGVNSRRAAVRRADELALS